MDLGWIWGGSGHRKSIGNLSEIYRKSIENLSKIYGSGVYLGCIWGVSGVYLGCIWGVSGVDLGRSEHGGVAKIWCGGALRMPSKHQK